MPPDSGTDSGPGRVTPPPPADPARVAAYADPPLVPVSPSAPGSAPAPGPVPVRRRVLETWRDIALVAGKDLRVEWRSRATLGQIVPFAGLVLILFGFALGADRHALRQAAPGVFWLTALFVTVVAAQRSTAAESADSARRMLLLAGVHPGAVFAGKAAAVAVQLLAVELAMAAGVLVFYGARVESLPLMAATGLAATVGLAAAGSLLAALVAGVRARETILPVLLMPVAAPVLIGAARAFDAALGSAAADGWRWLGLLAVFSVVNVMLGVGAYGPLAEEV